MRTAINILVIAIIILTTGIFIGDAKSFKQSMGAVNKIKKYIIKSIDELAMKLVPKSGSKKSMLLSRTIDKAFLSIRIAHYYRYKIICSIAAGIIIGSIFITNVVSYRIQSIQEVDIVLANVLVNNTMSRVGYREIVSGLDVRRVLNLTREEAVDYISRKIRVLTAVEERQVGASEIVLNELSQSLNIFEIFTPYLLWVVGGMAVGYILPNMYIATISRSRYKKFDSEIQNMEVIVLTLGSVPSITVRDIIGELTINSRLFKEILGEFNKTYILNRDSAYKEMLEKPISKDLEKLIVSLRQMETSDRDLALSALERSRENRKQVRRTLSEEWTQRKELICLVMYIIVFVAILQVVMFPWVRELGVFNQINTIF